MNKFKDNKIVFDIFYQFDFFEKYIDGIIDNKGDVVLFKCNNEFGDEQNGKITISDDRKIEIAFEGENKELLEKIFSKFENKNYDYCIKDENTSFNYNSKEQNYEKNTYRNDDFITFINETFGMKIPNKEYKYINVNKDNNISKGIIKMNREYDGKIYDWNTEIKEISFKNFDYKKGMENDVLEKQLSSLKYNEISFLKHILDCGSLNGSNEFLKKKTSEIEKQLSAQIFETELKDEKEILKIKNTPGKYTEKEILQSIKGYLYHNDPEIIEFSENQKGLIKFLLENALELDIPCIYKFSIENFENVNFEFGQNKIEVYLKENVDKNTDELFYKLFHELDIYREICQGNENTPIKIYDKNDKLLIFDDVDRKRTVYFPRKEFGKNLLNNLQNVSKYENKIIGIMDKERNFMEINNDNLLLVLNPETRNFKHFEKVQLINNLIEKYNLKNIFENIEKRDIDIKNISNDLTKENSEIRNR